MACGVGSRPSCSGIGAVARFCQRAGAGGPFHRRGRLVDHPGLLSTASSAFSLPLAGGIGDRQIDPTIATLESEYRLVAGQLEIDLADVQFPEGETRLEASVTFGRVYIKGIPDDVAVSVDARIAAGELAVFGSRWDGISIDQLRSEPGFDGASRRLVIEARVGFGQVEVNR